MPQLLKPSDLNHSSYLHSHKRLHKRLDRQWLPALLFITSLFITGLIFGDDALLNEGSIEDEPISETENQTGTDTQVKETQKIYRWVNQEGNIVFGDTPQKIDRAESIDLAPTTILKFHEPVNSTPVKPSSTKIQPFKYTQLKIITPSNDQTLRHDTGNVTISVMVEPSLHKGHQIQLYLDAKPFGVKQSSGDFALSNIDRGTHTVHATIINQQGGQVMNSPSITFHLHRFRQSGAK